MLTFLVKMLLCSCLLYGYYFLLLRDKTFHQYNRFYILLSTVACFIIPCLSIPVSYSVTKENFPLFPSLNVIAGEFYDGGNNGSTLSMLAKPTTLLQLFSCLIYVAGALFFAYTLMKSLLVIRKLSQRYQPQRWEEVTIYSTVEAGTPFSFFRTIYWNKNIDVSTPQGQQVFRHELYHVRQIHTADVLFMELICIIGWINPFFHLARKELTVIHEYLADRHAVSTDNRYDYAELLLLHTMASRNSPITHNFFNNYIKRRITMLTTFAKTRHGYWSRLMILPLASLLFCFMGLRAGSPSPGRKVPITVVIDAGHGGMDGGARSDQGINEKQLCLDIAKSIKELSGEYQVKVIMTREGDELPGNTTDKSESLKTRVAIAQQAGADLFVSIHINFAPPPGEKEGFDIYVPSANSKNPYLERSKVAGSIFLSLLKDKFRIASALNLQENQSIYVLNRAPCPAVMVSCGYMSNGKDVKLLTSKEHQEAIARKILEGVVQFKSL